VLEAMVAPLILFLIPIHPISLIAFGFVSFGFNVYGHLGFEIAPKWFRNSFLFGLMVTSTHHNIHHSKFKGNYGLYFRFWDKLMGTEHPDYVKEYDNIQKRRFGDSKSNFALKSHALTAFIALAVVLLLISASSPKNRIEGKWIFQKNGAVVEMDEKDVLFFGELIKTSNEEDNKKILEKGKIILLNNFEKESETVYCCGTLFAPKKDMILDATMILEDPNTLRVNAKYGILQGTEILEKLNK